MARMYPESFPSLVNDEDRRTKRAEMTVYEQLKRQLPTRFTVFWSVRWLAKQRGSGARDGEVDFVVVHPDLGVLIIEVKGGSIRYDARTGTLVSIDRNSEQHSISPFRQVNQQFYSLRRKLQESPITAKHSYPLACAVWFPDVVVGGGVELGPEAPRGMILDSRDLRNVHEGILRVIGSWYSTRVTAATRIDGGVGQHGTDAIIRLLAPTYEIQSYLATQLSQEQEVARRLTEEQFTVLDDLANARRALVCGIAGSGKTMLAIEKAQRLANEGYAVLLTCYNRNLADSLAASVVAHERITVTSFPDLCQTWAREAGLSTAATAGDEYIDDALPQALIEAVGILRRGYDAIIVDEGQDFTENWWLSLQYVLHDPDDGILYIFYDDNQKVYDRGSTNFPFTEPAYQLSVNCRNTQTIHRATLPYCRTNRQISCVGPAGREVLRISCPPEAVQEELRRTLHEVVNKNGVPAKDVVVLTPTQDESAWAEGTKLGNLVLTWDLKSGRQNAIRCCTVQGFKGLECPLAIITEMEKAAGSIDALHYIARSRATSHLIILGAA